jgi:hypothetical protein
VQLVVCINVLLEDTEESMVINILGKRPHALVSKKLGCCVSHIAMAASSRGEAKHIMHIQSKTVIAW